MKIAATTPTDVFGKITPPKELDPLIQKGGQGAGGISQFLTSAVYLMFEIAVVAVTIYLVWGALEWIVSGGDKEALASARKRITHALVGLVLLAIIFAVLNVLNIFTGFEFFGM